MQQFKSKYGPWAVVTGASAGLGELFARKLAARGLNLVLIARRRERLDNLAAELAERHGVEVRAVEVDLGREDCLAPIRAATDDIEVGLLVNNAGFTNSGEFLDNSLDSELLLVHVNIRAAMVLAHHFGRRMRDRHRGGMIFSASVAGYAAIPYWSNYAASKAYDLFLAEGLAEELRPHGVDVLALCPGATHTEFASYQGLFAKLFAMGPELVIAQALASLGKRPVTVVGWLNLTSVLSYRLVPRRFASWVAGKVIRDMVNHG